jgi:glycosyltransferase involved in cell wall biosynthesis
LVKSLNKSNISNKVINYIAVGKLDPWRGFDLLIEAFNLAVKTNPNIKLQIIGKGLDWKRLNKLIVKNNLSEHIKMLGEVSMNEYKSLMVNSDIVVNPCLKEGAVTTAFDAMAMGKPLICTDTTGYTRYFSSENAILIPIGRRVDLIDDLKNAILELTNEQLRLKLGGNAMNIREQFTWEKRVLEIYNTITSVYKNNLNN